MPDLKDLLPKDKTIVKTYYRSKPGTAGRDKTNDKDMGTAGCFIVAIVAILLVGTYVIPPVTKWVGENTVLIGVVLAIIVIVGIVALYKRFRNK